EPTWSPAATMRWSSPRSKLGSFTPCLRASSRIVSSRSEPSRWQCRSVLGRRWISSSGISAAEIMANYLARPCRLQPRFARGVLASGVARTMLLCGVLLGACGDPAVAPGDAAVQSDAPAPARLVAYVSGNGPDLAWFEVAATGAL